MTSNALVATVRSETGKGAARRSRRAGTTPGVLYRSGGDATSLNFQVAELAAIFRKTKDPNSVVTVNVDGVSHPCLVREVQRHPVSREVVHVDFFEVSTASPVTVEVVVATTGRAAGTRAGGVLRVLARAVNVSCPAGSIPSQIVVDVTNLGVGEFIKASQLQPPAGCSVVFKQDFNVVTVEGKRTAKEEAGAPAAAAPAAGGKAAPAAKPAAKK